MKLVIAWGKNQMYVLTVFGNKKRELKGKWVCIGKLICIFQRLLISVKMYYLIQIECDRP